MRNNIVYYKVHNKLLQQVQSPSTLGGLPIYNIINKIHSTNYIIWSTSGGLKMGFTKYNLIQSQT